MTTKHTPATPLPWKVDDDHSMPPAVIRDDENGFGVAECDRAEGFRKHGKQDAAYIAHACNAYPRLVEALEMVLEVAAIYAPTERAAISGRINHARALLAELGE